MQELECSAWTVRQSCNLWGQVAPDEGTLPEMGLFLIYGPLFGLVKREDDDQIRTRFGPVLDDVERTLRVFNRDGCIARYKRYAVVKLKQPGAFVAQAGGVSALYANREAHAAAKRWQLERLQNEFPHLVKLKTGDISDLPAPFRFIRSGNLHAESEAEPADDQSDS